MAYATATAKAFCNTGFSAANTPASPSVLQSAAGSVVDIGTINILPILGQAAGTIEVPAFAEIDTADYIAISQNPAGTMAVRTSYWTIQGYSYVTVDTLSISIVLDAFFLFFCITGITSISGIINRRTTKTDEYGVYDQSDPMLTPSEPLIFRAVADMPEQISGGYYTIILASFHLGKFGRLSAAQMGLTYGAAEQNVTCPNVPNLTNDAYTEIQCADRVYRLPAIAAFDGTNENVRTGISRARSIGVESGIIAQYLLPETLFEVTVGSDGLITAIKSGNDNTGVVNGPACAPKLKFDYATVNNKRALYGDYNVMRLVSTSTGDQAEYDPATLRKTEAGVNLDYPEFEVFSDGRAHGKPYCYPRYFRGVRQQINNITSFITGMEWQAAPLAYDYASGAGMARMFFSQQTKVDSMNMGEQMGTAAAQQVGHNLIGGMLGGFNAGLGGTGRWQYQKNPFELSGYQVTGFKPGDVAGAFLGVGSTVLNTTASTMMGIGDSLRNFQVASDVYNRSRSLEEAKLLAANYAVAPEIAFPPAESIRDFVGNRFRLYQITPTDNDLKRMDRILNMYGYKDVGSTLSLDDLSAGKYYSYVQASNIAMETSSMAAKWLKELVYEQFAAGIRIWKQKPDFTLYDQNNRA